MLEIVIPLLIVFYIYHRIRSRSSKGRNAYTIAVVGEGHQNRDGASRQALIRKHCKSGVRLAFQREPENPYDANAVAVMVAESRAQIGYLSKDNAKWVAEVMDRGGGFDVAVTEVIGGTRKKPSLGVIITATKLR